MASNFPLFNQPRPHFDTGAMFTGQMPPVDEVKRQDDKHRPFQPLVIINYKLLQNYFIVIVIKHTVLLKHTVIGRAVAMVGFARRVQKMWLYSQKKELN